MVRLPAAASRLCCRVLKGFFSSPPGSTWRSSKREPKVCITEGFGSGGSAAVVSRALLAGLLGGLGLPKLRKERCARVREAPPALGRGAGSTWKWSACPAVARAA